MDRLTVERMAHDAANGYGAESDMRHYVQELAAEVARLREDARWVPVGCTPQTTSSWRTTPRR